MNTTTDTIHVTRDGEGEHWLVGTDVTTIKASARDTSGNLLVLEVKVPPGGGPSVLHRHEYSESFLFQEGETPAGHPTAGGSRTAPAATAARRSYRMRSDGSAQKRLTDNGVPTDSGPVFSPDGRQIAFQSNRDGNFEIYKMHTDGKGPVNLTNDPAGDFTPDWKPLEKRL